MIWYPARVLLPVGIVAGLILGCAHGRATAQRDVAETPPPPPPPSPSTGTAEDIARQPPLPLGQLIAGRVAGLRVARAPRGGISIQNRGQTSLSPCNEPPVAVRRLP